MQGIGQTIYDLYLLLPTWLLIAIGVVAVFFLVPGWVRRIQMGHLRTAVRTAVVARDEASRDLAVKKALEQAKNQPKHLAYLVETARRMGQPTIASKALEALEAVSGSQDSEVTRLKAAAAPDKRRADHPMQIAIAVERLLESGLLARARHKLDEGLAAYPDDKDLRMLERRLLTAEQAEAAPREQSS